MLMLMLLVDTCSTQVSGGKRQLPHMALRKFMSLVFKNRTDISPLNPLAAIFLCMANVSDLRDFILSNTYKAQLKPEKNKPCSVDLNISGEWDAQEVYHGGRHLSLAQHFALCGSKRHSFRISCHFVANGQRRAFSFEK